MTMTKTIGGDRLGSGKKMTVDLKTYERSTHDLSYIWRSTMAAGTLTPFMAEVGLPGDTFDIDLSCEVLTHPTVGPLFGSYKVQLDVFMSPIRLYNSYLHNNMLNIGLNMADIKLPQIVVEFSGKTTGVEDLDNEQINPSCILSYLGMRGLGSYQFDGPFARYFNATSFISYWDINKNYYCNKQEEIGAVIHNVITLQAEPAGATMQWGLGNPDTNDLDKYPTTGNGGAINNTLEMRFFYTPGDPWIVDWSQILINTNLGWVPLGSQFTTIVESAPGSCSYTFSGFTGVFNDVINWRYATSQDVGDDQPQIVTFPLSNIDDMRNAILSTAGNTPFLIDSTSAAPYGLVLEHTGTDPNIVWSQQTNMEGLALKTYQSDVFNNWLKTEWITGPNSIAEVTAISTVGDSFTIDSLLLARKVYDMLNRIAISDGSFRAWIDTVYTANTSWQPEIPVYQGGLIRELAFQEVISNSEAGQPGNEQPLGTLAGRGVMTKKHKGGKVVVKVEEPCYIMGIVSLTPRIDYSQGNRWDTNLKTMDDLHKPALDEMGFQDLITDQMAWWDTQVTDGAGTLLFKSAGKQPAWINYMTNYNRCYGNFAKKNEQMFMTLARRYEHIEYSEGDNHIKDLTTYIDPVKFNYIFAQTDRGAQNFWTQIGVDITARRKMSAKIMPNL